MKAKFTQLFMVGDLLARPSLGSFISTLCFQLESKLEYKAGMGARLIYY